jgi:hypothetical protein
LAGRSIIFIPIPQTPTSYKAKRSEVKDCGKKEMWCTLRYNPGIYPEMLRKNLSAHLAPMRFEPGTIIQM